LHRDGGQYLRVEVTAGTVLNTFRTAASHHGYPASTLTDIQAWWCPEGPRIVRPAV
jgi:hypothetical protein